MKVWKRKKANSENLVDMDGKVHGHINKFKNEGWRAFVGDEPIIDRATRKPKNFKTVKDAKSAVENACK